MSHHSRILAKARKHDNINSQTSRFNGVETAADLDALPHIERYRGMDAGSSTSGNWPPQRGQKRPHSPTRHAPMDVEAYAAANTTAQKTDKVELASFSCSVKGAHSRRLSKSIPQTKAKGITYYGGIHRVVSSCVLKLVREPSNAYDSNAIKVALPSGEQVGHLPRGTAGHLAPLMDSKEVKARAKAATFSTRPQYDLPIIVTLLGKPELATDERLKFARPAPPRNYQAQTTPHGYAQNGRGSHGIPPTNMVVGSSAQAGLSQMTRGQAAVQRPRADMLATLFSEFDPATLPLHDQPHGLKTKLLPHQLQALAWMTMQEHPKPPKDDKPVQLWQKREGGQYYNVATHETSSHTPALARGGCLADEMGLGKTLTSIALIALPPDGSKLLNATEVEEIDERYAEATLIVCPLSVISNWTGQIKQHAGKKVKAHVYHGEGRHIGRAALREVDVVITTYQTLASEYMPEDAPAAKKKRASFTADGELKNGKLHRIAWRRVILDEGHIVRNVRTQLAKACHALRAERRWTLTGTPVVNSAKDMGAALHFLRLCAPLDDPKQWTQIVEKGYKKGLGGILLRAVVTATTLRRTKDMKGADGQPIIKLPPLKVYLHKVVLETQARVIYDEIEKGVQSSVLRSINNGDLSRSYSAMLVFLLRLRQIACHPSLCPPDFIEDVRAGLAALPDQQEPGAAVEPAISLEQRRELQRVLLELRYEDCSICFSTPEEPLITKCAHAYCDACINQVIDLALGQGQEAHCPMCRRPIAKNALVPLPDEPLPPAEEDGNKSEEQVEEADNLDMANEMSEALLSAKSRELVRLLQGAAAEGARTLVFSQWTKHLDLIGRALEENDIGYARYDGSMSAKKRDGVIDEFQAGRGPDVMLLSLHCAALGLNLTAASCVVLMDPWWQSAIEQQAIDRTYRLGQSRDVRVFQMIAEGTVEERVLAIQQQKQKVIADAFAGVRGAHSERAKIESRIGDVLEAFGLARDAATAPAQ